MYTTLQTTTESTIGTVILGGGRYGVVRLEAAQMLIRASPNSMSDEVARAARPNERSTVNKVYLYEWT